MGISLSNLEELYLDKNRLSGPIPTSITNASKLTILSLQDNSFTGPIPDFGNLSSQIGNLKAIYVVDLSINHFSSDIPNSLEGCQSLETLSLLSNMFSGSIPKSLGSVRGLSTLDLSNNNLSGFIPKSLEQLGFLAYFNVSYNRLDGEIPNGGPFGNFSAQSFLHNSGLCGLPRFQVPPCMVISRSRSRSRPRLKDIVRVMVYIVASLISAIIWVMGIFLSITFVIIIKRQRYARTQTHLSDDHTSLGVVWKIISHRELVQATGGFSETNLLGIGGFSSVYKGTLPNGLDIAVKVFNLELEGAAESFDTETEILSSIRHRNLVRMIGCCANAEFKALILDYMTNGSLEEWLCSDTHCLDLVQTLNIAVDVALALEHLHHHHTFPVVHCDIKPSNVLLTEDMTAHLADFGISKLLDKGEAVVQTKSFATIGYAAPEYGFEGKVSTKGDVYSYGIMLLEMLTRKKPTDDMFDGHIGLKEWVSEAVERNAISEVVDHALFLNEECMSSVFDLAMKCLAISPGKRINMIQAATALQRIKDNIVNTELTQKSSPYYSIAGSSPASDHMSFSMELDSWN
ncbi:hypothetical protein ACS0TY_027843 [Phlomoides rotata]